MIIFESLMNYLDLLKLNLKSRWSDGDKSQISLTIDDSNITRHSLHITLGSFYRVSVIRGEMIIKGSFAILGQRVIYTSLLLICL